MPPTGATLLGLLISSTAHLAVAATACKQVPAPKSGILCAVRGFPRLDIGVYSTGQPLIASSLLECASQCGRRLVTQSGTNHAAQSNAEKCISHETQSVSASFCTYCAGVLWDQKTGFCQLTSSDFDEQSFQQSSRSDTLYYSSSCFDCGGICDTPNYQPVGAEILDNSNFKGQLLGPWSSITDGTVVKGDAISNIYECDARKDSRGRIASSSTITQGFNICAYSLYSVAFDLEMPATTANISKTVLVSTPTTSLLQTWPRNFTTKAKNLRLFFRGPQAYSHNSPLTFNFQDNYPQYEPVDARDIYRLSNVRVRRLPDAPATKSGPGSSIRLKPNTDTQEITVKRGTAYLFVLSFTTKRSPYGLLNPSFLIEIDQDEYEPIYQSSSFEDTFQVPHPTNRTLTWSCPFVASAANLRIGVREVNFSVFTINELSVTELEDQTIGL